MLKLYTFCSIKLVDKLLNKIVFDKLKINLKNK